MENEVVVMEISVPCFICTHIYTDTHTDRQTAQADVIVSFNLATFNFNCFLQFHRYLADAGRLKGVS